MIRIAKQVDENELVMYFIVNKELPMSKGKIAGQVAHVTTNIVLDICTLAYDDPYMENPKVENFDKWYHNGSQKKIILEAKEKDLIKLKEQGFYYIEDNGLTEIEAGSLTCVGLGVMTRLEAKPHIKRMQLLK